MYTLYLDDTGTATLKTPNPRRPITCLCGIVFEDTYYNSQAHAAISQFKSRHLGNRPIPLRRYDINSARDHFHGLRNKKKALRFHEELNSTLAQLEFHIIAVVVHVPQFQEAIRAGYYFPELPSDDYARVVALAVERFARLLSELQEVSGKAVKGRVVAEAKGRKEDMRLKQYYEEELLPRGTAYYRPEDFRAVLLPEIEIRNKREDVYGLQVADWVAWPLVHNVGNPDGEVT